MHRPAGEQRCCGVKRPVLSTELFFQKGFYYYLMASNLLLRLAWTYKLSPHLRRNHDTVLAFTLLEARTKPHIPYPTYPSPCTLPGPCGLLDKETAASGRQQFLHATHLACRLQANSRPQEKTDERRLCRASV